MATPAPPINMDLLAWPLTPLREYFILNLLDLIKSTYISTHPQNLICTDPQTHFSLQLVFLNKTNHIVEYFCRTGLIKN